MTKQLKVYFLDILDAIDEIEEFTKNLTFDEFTKNKMAIRAVTMDFAIIGEATKQIPEETKREYPKIPWKQMAGIRDKIIHGYAYIKLTVLWDAVNLDLPAVKPLVKELLESEFKESDSR
ncbi:MAG: DUF86 domain-containing protein [Candidatus Bathyarchaeia archaeon]|jgi:uncharacterized protein with HEPN domain